MQFRKVKRGLMAASVIAAAAAVPMITAAPASANAAQCAGILRHYGYDVGPKSLEACGWSAIIPNTPSVSCYSPLLGLGVNPDHAYEACRWA